MICDHKVLNRLRAYNCVKTLNSNFDLNYVAFDKVSTFNVENITSDNMNEINSYHVFMNEINDKFKNVKKFNTPFAVIKVNSNVHIGAIENVYKFINNMMDVDNFAKVESFLLMK